jgi:hypothetical protein
LSQELRCKNTNTEDGKNFQQSGSHRNEKDCFQQTYEMKPKIRGTPRMRQLKRKNTDSADPAPRRPIHTQLTSDSLTDSAGIEVSGNIMINVRSHVLKSNGKFCSETDESGCARLGQPHTYISGDSFKSCSVSVKSSSVCDKSSSLPFNTARSGLAQSTHISSQSTTNPLTTSILPGKHPDTSLNELG